MPSLTRRQLLLGLAATPFAYTLACTAQARPTPPTTRPLPIPPLAESTVGADGTRHFTLRAMIGESDMLRGLRTPTWGFNGAVLGPTLRARRGEAVAVTVENRLPEPTTVHWHGMHVPPRCDGGPHQPISPGGDWTPGWTYHDLSLGVDHVQWDMSSGVIPAPAAPVGATVRRAESPLAFSCLPF